MCGLFDTIKIEESIAERYNVPKLTWQSKTVYGYPMMATYKIENDRLYRRHKEHRDMTACEKQEYAEKHGFDTYYDMEAFYRMNDVHACLRRGFFAPRTQVIKRIRWIDHNQHGSFRIYGTVEGEYMSFECTFREGVLIDITRLK